MATSTDVLRILLTGDSRSVVQAFKDAQGAADKMSVAGRALTTGVTLPLVGLGVAAIGAAADLEAAGAKAQQVFGASSAEVEAFAETTTEAYGISERAALQAAGTFGNLFTSMGLTQEGAADMSIELIGLAGDLAAFHDIAREDVLAKLQSGLVGEIEPLRSLGVSFNAAQVDAAAMAVAIADGRDEITEADKVAARFNLILEGTANAQGQAAREADSLSAQQARATAEMEDAAAAIGQELLPAVADATGMIADLAGWFGDLPQPVQSTAVKVGVFAAALGPAVLIGGKLATTLTSLKASLVAVGAGRASAAAGAAAGIGLVVLALYQAEQRAETARRKFEELSAAMSDGFENSALQGELQSWELTLDQLGTSSDEVGRALISGEDAWQSFIDSFIARQDNVDDAATALYGLNVVVETYREQIEAASGTLETHAERVDRIKTAYEEKWAAIRATRDAMGSYSGIVERTANAFTDLNRGMDRHLELLGLIHGVTMSVSEAEIAVFDSIDAVAQSLETNGPVLDRATEAGRRNSEEVENLAGSYIEYAQALADAKRPQEEVNNALAYGRESVRGVLEQFGVAPQYIDPYLDALGLIPVEIKTDIRVQFPPKTDMRAIGRDLAEGVAEGIEGGLGAVQAAIGGLVLGAAAHGKLVSQSNSPSKLFADEVGGPISEGVAQGILDALDAPQSAIDTLFDELVSRGNDGANSVISGIGSVFSSADAQDRVTRAEENLRTGLPRGPEYDRNLRELQEAQLALIRSQEAMVEAGQELLGQGPEGVARFRELGEMSGLSPAALDALVAQLENATAWAGQFLPGDVGALIGSGASTAVTNNITINTGADPDAVVAAIRQYERGNGVVLLA